jgi:Tol biopolymer transport system component
MTDQLLEALRALDPATDDAVTQLRHAARPEAVRDRIATMPFDTVPRWRRALGRRPSNPTPGRIAVIVTALLVAAAGIVIPIRLFGDGSGRVASPGADGTLLATIVGVRADGTVDPNRRFDLASIDLATGEVTRLTHTFHNEAHPVWSPDGSQVAFVRTGAGRASVVVAAPDLSDERVVAEVASISQNVSWLPDGHAIGYVGDHGLETVDLATGDVTTIARLPDLYVTGPISWSPDGTLIAFAAIAKDDQFGEEYLYVVGADGSDPHRLIPDSVLDLNEAPAWSPDSGTLVYQDFDNELSAVDVASGRVSALTSSAHQGASQLAGVSAAPAFSPDGSQIAFLRNGDGEPYNLWVMDADGSDAHQITHLTDAEFTSISWGPTTT